jgi:uncharacterized repeat protein (TIGR02543 family)
VATANAAAGATVFSFVGWYDNPGFNGLPITQISADAPGDITLYAKWVSMYPSAYTSEYVDIAKYNNSTSQKGVVVTAISQANKNYYYFTCYFYISIGTFY